LDRRSLGLEGEARAARFLEARGYRIVARNVRAARVEIDLIARRGPLLVFVEVKTRRADRHGLAAEAVDPRKQQRLRRGALAWLAARPEAARGVRTRRFDVVTCLFDPRVGMRSCGRRDGAPGRPTDASDSRNETTPPVDDEAGWSYAHWESAF